LTRARDVEVALNKAGEFFASFNSMLADPAAADASEFDWTVKELRKLVSSVTEDLDELADTVDAIKADPKRFKVCGECSAVDDSHSSCFLGADF
jgi:archaellum component FlaC